MLHQFMKELSHSNVKFVTTNFLESHLNRHVAFVHEGKKLITCDFCDYTCSQKGNLNQHVASVHEGKKPFKCGIVTSAVLQRVA